MKMELRLKISDEIGRTFMPLHVQLLKPKIAVTFSKEGRKNKLFLCTITVGIIVINIPVD